MGVLGWGLKGKSNQEITVNIVEVFRKMLFCLVYLDWFKHVLFHLYEKGLGRAQMLC